MRLFVVSTFAVAAVALGLARWAEPGPLWHAALYALPLAVSLLVVALTCASLKQLLGAKFDPVAPALAAALGMFALLYSLFERAPGTFPRGLPLDHLAEKALSLGALGAALAAGGLGAFGLRQPFLASRAAAALAIAEAAVAGRGSLAALGLPALGAWSLSLLAIGAGLALARAPVRRRQAPDSRPGAREGLRPGPFPSRQSQRQEANLGREGPHPDPLPSAADAAGERESR